MITTTYNATKLKPYADPESAITESVPFSATKTIAKGTVLGQVTSTGKYEAYDGTVSTGVEVARAICMYDITTDGSGNVTIANDKGLTHTTAPIYIGGIFRTNELTGLDDDAVEQLAGQLTSGDVSDGVLKF
jgi:hypothetical protein